MEKQSDSFWWNYHKELKENTIEIMDFSINHIVPTLENSQEIIQQTTQMLNLLFSNNEQLISSIFADLTGLSGTM